MPELQVPFSDFVRILRELPASWWTEVKPSVLRQDKETIVFDMSHPAYAKGPVHVKLVQSELTRTPRGKSSLIRATAAAANSAVEGVTVPPTLPAIAHAPRPDIRPFLWNELHRRPLMALDLAKEQPWLDAFGTRVPCGECRVGWRGILKELPWDLSSRSNYFAWTVMAHNLVNRKLGKNELTIDEAARLYGCDMLDVPSFAPPATLDDLTTLFDRVVYIDMGVRSLSGEQLERKDLRWWPFKQPEWISSADFREFTAPTEWGHGNAEWTRLKKHLKALEPSTVTEESFLAVEADSIWDPDFPQRVRAFFQAVPADWHAIYFGRQTGTSAVVRTGVRRVWAPQGLHGFCLRGSVIRALSAAWRSATNPPERVAKELLGRHFIAYAPDPPLIGLHTASAPAQ